MWVVLERYGIQNNSHTAGWLFWFLYFTFHRRLRAAVSSKRYGTLKQRTLCYVGCFGLRLLNFMNVLTRFNDGFNKVFQRAFEYAPPQGQESCKIHVSRNCIASSAHYQTTHGCCCED